MTGGSPERAAKPSTAAIRFTVDGRPCPFHPSVVTSFDVGKLAVGATVAVPPTRATHRAPTSRPWRLYAGPVVATVLYAVIAYYAFLR